CRTRSGVWHKSVAIAGPRFASGRGNWVVVASITAIVFGAAGRVCLHVLVNTDDAPPENLSPPLFGYSSRWLWTSAPNIFCPGLLVSTVWASPTETHEALR